MVDNFTKIPNFIIDEYMGILTPAEFSVIVAIARKTIGWHKKSDLIAISTFVKMTGLSDRGISKCLKNLEKKGIIKKTRVDMNESGWYYNQYELLTDRVNTVQTPPNSVPPTPRTQFHPPPELSSPSKEILNKYKEKERGGFETPSKENQAPPPDSMVENESNGAEEKSNVIYFEQIKKTTGELKMEKTEKEWKPNVPDWLREKVESPEGAEKLSETEKKFRSMSSPLPAKPQPIVNQAEREYSEKMREIKQG